MDLIQRIYDWSAAKIEARRLDRFGGLQSCPWCRQTAQQGEAWRIVEWERDPFLDVLTCGICGGTSLWRFEMGMIYIGPLDPPRPAHDADPRYDIEAACLRLP